MNVESTSDYQLSIIVIILMGGAPLRGCLTELKNQGEAMPLEIIVPCDEGFQDFQQFQEDFPSIIFIKVSGRKTYAELRSLGVRESRGAVVAVTEDQCRPQDDWSVQILMGHRLPHAAVGGAVEKLVPDQALGWAIYFADYVRYMRPMPAGSTVHLTDCNVSYKRQHLDAISQVWKWEFHEPEVHNALMAQGHTLWFSPDMVVYQKRYMDWALALKDRWSFGRLFGSRRIMNASLAHRMMYGLAALAMPLVTVLRVTRSVIQKKRQVPQFFRALPALAILNCTWALGECMGYWSGRSGAMLSPKDNGVVGKDRRESE